MYWNFVAIDGVIKNQLDKYATGFNTQRLRFGFEPNDTQLADKLLKKRLALVRVITGASKLKTLEQYLNV
jgi:hypothetical protein